MGYYRAARHGEPGELYLWDLYYSRYSLKYRGNGPIEYIGDPYQTPDHLNRSPPDLVIDSLHLYH